MKKLTSELRGRSVNELEKEAQKLREEIAKLKLETKVNAQKDTNVLIKKKKKLAVVLTFLTEKNEIEKVKAESESKNK